MASAGYSQKAEKYYKMGNEKQQLQDYQGAIDYYSKAIKLKPKYAEAYFKRGRSKYQIENYGEAILDFNKAIMINPTYAEAYVYRGLAKVALQDSYFKDFQQYQPSQPHQPTNNYLTPSQMKVFKITAKDSALYLKRQRESKSCPLIDTSKETIKSYTKAIKTNHMNASAYVNRGIARMKKEDYVGAIADFTKALEINPRDTNTYYFRGSANYTRGEYTEAVKDFTKVIDIDPMMAAAYFNRGSAKGMLNDTSSIADFVKAIDIDPLFKWSTNIGGIYPDLPFFYDKDYSGAIADLDKAIGINPTYAEAYYRRGLAKVESSQNESGCLDLNKAGELGIAAAYVDIKKYCK